MCFNYKELYAIRQSLARQGCLLGSFSLNYNSILCDDNNRKPICRLHFNGKHKSIGILDANKNEERVALDNLNEIYKLADKLKATAGSYVNHKGI